MIAAPEVAAISYIHMNKLLRILLWIACSGSPVLAQLATNPLPPPSAARHSKDVSQHGDRRIDDYFWLRDRADPAVLEYLTAENSYTAAVTAPAAPLREKLFQEMVGRLQETDTSAATPDGAWLYYSRTEKGKQYRIYCRRARAGGNAPEIVLLDLNQLGVGRKFVGLGEMHVSDDGNLLAYSIDYTGHRDYELVVQDLRTGRPVAQQVGTASSFEWAADNDTIFFTKEEPASKRSYRLGRCVLSSGRIDILYEERDDIYDLGLARSDDRAFLFCTAESKQTTEVRALPASTPAGEWRVLLPRENDHKYFAEHRNGLYYFLTNKVAKNYRIVTAPVATPDVAHWKDFVPARAGTRVSDLRLFANHAVVSEREGGLPYLRVIDLRTNASERIRFPEAAYEAELADNPEYNTVVVRFTYESPVTPASVFEYNMTARTRALVKQTEVPGYQPGQYTCERILLPAQDGTKIPVTLVYRTALRGKPPQPLWLYGYGSYGYSLPDSFSSPRVSLLDRGLIYAVAHVRGGGELGEGWREAGRMERKQTTFSDFIACADGLVRAGYTTPAQLAMSGGSAGGMLMGAVLNQRPDLCRVAVAQVPFVDVLNTMLDPTLPLTTAEYIEWGNPTVKKEYAWMRAYSPYDNIKRQAYPALLVTTSLNDSQVPYWEAAKFVAKLRALKTDNHPLLLKAELDPAGHGGVSGRYDALKETAFLDAFVLSVLGLDQRAPAR